MLEGLWYPPVILSNGCRDPSPLTKRPGREAEHLPPAPRLRINGTVWLLLPKPTWREQETRLSRIYCLFVYLFWKENKATKQHAQGDTAAFQAKSFATLSSYSLHHVGECMSQRTGRSASVWLLACFLFRSIPPRHVCVCVCTDSPSAVSSAHSERKCSTL